MMCIMINALQVGSMPVTACPFNALAVNSVLSKTGIRQHLKHCLPYGIFQISRISSLFLGFIQRLHDFHSERVRVSLIAATFLLDAQCGIEPFRTVLLQRCLGIFAFFKVLAEMLIALFATNNILTKTRQWEIRAMLQRLLHL